VQPEEGIWGQNLYLFGKFDSFIEFFEKKNPNPPKNSKNPN